ncbi:MAG: AIPR family protein [bacterium]
MERTIKEEPEIFWYLNNGITILCSEASKKGTAGKDYIKIKNAQVINGQQTVRVLYETYKNGIKNIDDTKVLVKLFVIEPKKSRGTYWIL